MYRHLLITLCLIVTVVAIVPGCLKKLDPNQTASKKSSPPPAAAPAPVPVFSAPATMFGFAAPGTQGKLLESASASFKVKQGTLGGDSAKAVATSASFTLRGNFYGL